MLDFNFDEEQITPKRAAELYIKSMNDVNLSKFKKMLPISKNIASNIAKYYKVDYDKFIAHVKGMIK